MKKPWLAFVLSLVIPGAGLAYLGKWAVGVANLFVATAIIAGLLTLKAESSYDYIHYVILALATGSAGLAHAWAARLRT